MLGKKFGLWTALADYGRRNKRPHWFCQCECGQTSVVDGYALKYGNTSGCHKCRGPKKVTHGCSGRDKTPEYVAWNSMKRRCDTPTQARWPHYGGRGISVCEAWRNSFEAFLKDLGPRPSPLHSLDRIDVNGNYNKANCRWATMREQMSNRTDTVLVAWRGAPRRRIDLCREFGISQRQLWNRLRHGFDLERAFTQPLRRCGGAL